MKNTMNYFTAGLITLSAMLATACHTVEGVGKDIGSAGDKIEDITRN